MKHQPLDFFQARYGDVAGKAIFLFVESHVRRCLPWTQAYANIRARCRNKSDRKFKYYGGRGILCELTPSNLRKSFMEQKAYLLKCPSVDRKDPDLGYIRGNIAWIEMEENRLSSKLGHPQRAKEFYKLKEDVVKSLESLKWSPYLKRVGMLRLVRELTPPTYSRRRPKSQKKI